MRDLKHCLVAMDNSCSSVLPLPAQAAACPHGQSHLALQSAWCALQTQGAQLPSTAPQVPGCAFSVPLLGICSPEQAFVRALQSRMTPCCTNSSDTMKHHKKQQSYVAMHIHLSRLALMCLSLANSDCNDASVSGLP